MDKGDFNSLSIEAQVEFFNNELQKGKSIRGICNEIGIAKSTIQTRFSLKGYTFSKVGNVYVTDALIIVDDKNSPDVGTKLDDQIIFMQHKLKSIVKDFIEVGIILNKISADETFRDRGYENILAFSQVELGLSRNQTYNLMNVANTFSIAGKIIDRYQDFSFSQLVEMLSLPEPVKHEISTDMTVKEIREIKKQVKQETEQIEGQIDIFNPVDEVDVKNIPDVVTSNEKSTLDSVEDKTENINEIYIQSLTKDEILFILFGLEKAIEHYKKEDLNVLASHSKKLHKKLFKLIGTSS